MNEGQGRSARGWLLPAGLALVAMVSAAVLALQAAAGPQAQPQRSTAGTTQAAPYTSVDRPRSSSVAPARRATALPGAGEPRGVVVDSLGIDAPVVPVETRGTSLDPPDDPQVLGWWSGGAPVGAAAGTALVTGHTVNAGGGAMDDLERLREGAEIRVSTGRGTVRYVAESVQVLDKATLAREAERLFSQQVAGRLVLVTCEDWDGEGYRSNVVVTAVPL